VGELVLEGRAPVDGDPDSDSEGLEAALAEAVPVADADSEEELVLEGRALVDGDIDSDGVGVADALRLVVSVTDEDGLGDSETDGVAVMVPVDVGDGAGVGELVREGVLVCVTDGVAVLVPVDVGDGAGVGELVREGVLVTLPDGLSLTVMVRVDVWDGTGVEDMELDDVGDGTGVVDVELESVLVVVRVMVPEGVCVLVALGGSHDVDHPPRSSEVQAQVPQYGSSIGAASSSHVHMGAVFRLIRVNMIAGGGGPVPVEGGGRREEGVPDLNGRREYIDAHGWALAVSHCSHHHDTGIHR
jgi:hypothetical protein